MKTVSFIGRDATTTTNASAFSFESLGMCLSFQSVKLSSHCLTKLAYLTMGWYRVLYSLFTCPTTSWESLDMMSFSEDTDFARLILTKIASYFVSLLNVGKSSRMACSILSPIWALSCKPTPTLVWQEALSTLRIHQPTSSWSKTSRGSYAKKSTNICRRARFILNNKFS